jgi:hypothetical protein
MELSTTREATSCYATRQFPSNLWNPMVQYGIHMTKYLINYVQEQIYLLNK